MLLLASSFSFPSTSNLCPRSVQLHPHPHRIKSYFFRWFRGHCLHSSFLPFIMRPPLQKFQFSVSNTLPQNEGVVSVMNYEELVEKDWSVLECAGIETKEERERKFVRIISAGNIVNASRVLVSLPSDDFVDTLVDTNPCQLLLVLHDSLLSLACIKERHDKVKCWQGELIYVPEKWAPFDVIFLYFLPALQFNLDGIFSVLANRCSPGCNRETWIELLYYLIKNLQRGARVVISHLPGRQILEQQRQQYSDIIVSDLPDKLTLQTAAGDHCFMMKEFVDEPGFYLAVLELNAKI